MIGMGGHALVKLVIIQRQYHAHRIGLGNFQGIYPTACRGSENFPSMLGNDGLDRFQ
jgi:hypothetical protein